MSENTLAKILLLRKVPFWTASPWRRVLRVVVLLALVYLGVLAMLLWLENRLLYAGAWLNTAWKAPSEAERFREVRLPMPGGSHVIAWITTPPDWTPQRGAVLFSHGNGRNVSTTDTTMMQWRDVLGRAVLCYDYPSYGRSPGVISEAACYSAQDAAYEWLVGEEKVPREEIILVGESLGGAMAIDMATRREHRCLITLAAFTSFPDMAQLKFPWLPARWLVSNQYRNIDKIAKARRPVFIVHGTEDALVPLSQGERLFAAAPEPKRYLAVSGWPHRHPDTPEFWQAARAFVAESGR
jgi:pimeloyl-ACP methyl ester carboxylesterase